jgi:hypothetical protein
MFRTLCTDTMHHQQAQGPGCGSSRQLMLLSRDAIAQAAFGVFAALPPDRPPSRGSCRNTNLFGQGEFLIRRARITAVLPDGTSSARVFETKPAAFDSNLLLIWALVHDLKKFVVG